MLVFLVIWVKLSFYGYSVIVPSRLIQIKAWLVEQNRLNLFKTFGSLTYDSKITITVDPIQSHSQNFLLNAFNERSLK